MKVSRLVLVPVLVGTCSILAHAEVPEKAPPESREQVAAALRALMPLLRSGGTLEGAIRAYAPGSFHPVTEGVLPPETQGACPGEMADVGHRFCVDKWEGSLVERRADGTEVPWSPFATPLEGRTYLAQSVAGTTPQAYVSASQAARACHAVGKRLCAPVEWRAACGGTASNAYPYGRARIPGKCHDTGTAPAVALHVSDLNDPRLDALSDTIGKTGAFPECVNDYGIYDMVGNVEEWTSDPNGTFQGGYWLDTSQHGEGCAYRTIAHSFDYHDYSTGFRCCADLVAPASPKGQGQE